MIGWSSERPALFLKRPSLIPAVRMGESGTTMEVIVTTATTKAMDFVMNRNVIYENSKSEI